MTRGKQPIQYAFDARHWHSVLERSFQLKKVFRQADPSTCDCVDLMASFD